MPATVISFAYDLRNRGPLMFTHERTMARGWSTTTALTRLVTQQRITNTLDAN